MLPITLAARKPPAVCKSPLKNPCPDSFALPVASFRVLNSALMLLTTLPTPSWPLKIISSVAMTPPHQPSSAGQSTALSSIGCACSIAYLRSRYASTRVSHHSAPGMWIASHGTGHASQARAQGSQGGPRAPYRKAAMSAARSRFPVQSIGKAPQPRSSRTR